MVCKARGLQKWGFDTVWRWRRRATAYALWQAWVCSVWPAPQLGRSATTQKGISMKIIVLGAGALGSIIGAHLVRAGEEVIFIARGHRAAFLQQHGIVIAGSGDFTVPVTVTTHPHEVQTTDVLFVTVKTYDTEPALASVRHLCVPSVLSVQNGVFKNEQLAQTFGWERVLGAAAFLSGELLPDGPVRFTVNRHLALGELPEGTSARAHVL